MRFGGQDNRKLPPKSGFLYRSRIVDQRFTEIIQKPLAFENSAYELRISGTVSTDKRIMSFVNVLWGFEVTGGIDQYEPLTIINVSKLGMARRAGIRIGDVITRINNTYAEGLTLLEAQLLILRSKKQVQIFVRGDADIEEDKEYTVDFWFKPRFRFPPVHVENKWSDDFAWNDRRKPHYRESNCFMVPSRNEEKAFRHDERIKEEHTSILDNRPAVNATVSDENVTSVHMEMKTQVQEEEEEEFISILDNRPVIIATESDENTTSTFDVTNGQNEAAATNTKSNGKNQP